MAGKRRGRDRQYTDSFLEHEEARHKALVVTICFLIGILIMTIVFLVVMYTYHSQSSLFKPASSGKETESELPIEILTDETETAVSLTGEKQQQTSESETEKTEIRETEPAAEQKTEKDTEKVTEKKGGRIDTAAIEQRMSELSDATAYGVYVYDLEEQVGYGMGQSDQPMYTSACLSVPILYTAAVWLDQGAATLNDPIIFVNSIGGRGLYNAYEMEGSEYPLSWYLKTMLQYSDNNCMNCLLDYFGLENVTAACRNAGYSSTDIQRKVVDEVTDGKENYVSAADLAGMVKELYNGRFTLIGREFMQEFFCIDETDEGRTLIGLSSELAENVRLLNQNGLGSTRYSEVAVITGDSVSYVVSMMLMGEEGFSYKDAAVEASGLIYRSLAG